MFTGIYRGYRGALWCAFAPLCLFIVPASLSILQEFGAYTGVLLRLEHTKSRYAHEHAHIYTKIIQYAHEHITGFWCIYGRAHEHTKIRRPCWFNYQVVILHNG